MSDIGSYISSVRQALDSIESGKAGLGDLLATLRALLEYACSTADDDLAECADRAVAWFADLPSDLGSPQVVEACGRVRAMVGTLEAAYEGPSTLEASQSVQFVDGGHPAPLAGSALAAPGQPTDGGLSAGDSDRDPEILAEFIIESSEHLAEAEQHLLALDSDPNNREALRSLFRGFHTIKGLSGFLDFPGIEVLAHASEDVLAASRDNDTSLPDGATDVILEAVDCLQRAIESIRTAVSEQTPMPEIRPGSERLLSQLRGLLGNEDRARSEERTRGRRPPAPARAEASSSSEQSDAAANESQAPEGEDGPAAPSGRVSAGPDNGAAQRGARDTIRVDAERLDRLVDMVGELVITESMVTRSVESISGTMPGLGRHITRMDKITRELHELAGSLRLVPVRATFRKMARLVRDVARKSGKKVSFKVIGEDAELDKTLVDRIGDPLVHMVRNAIDHGLEKDERSRVAAGKPPIGQVVLRALHRGGSVYVEVEDDGRGLDPAKILARAVERGLVKEGENLSRRDIIRLICEPGFSTADKVTAISGRGVGMDVVRQQIEAMRGSLDVTSELGKGTCFSMQLPLTLAVIDGMVMRLGPERYVVPTLSVVRLVKAHDATISTVMGRGEVLRLGEELIPVVRPKDLFGIEGMAGDRPLFVVVDADAHKVAMVVDELLGQQQVVIKSLGEGLGDIPGLAGCAIMPDGRVGIVLDVGGIVKHKQDVQEEELLEAG